MEILMRNNIKNFGIKENSLTVIIGEKKVLSCTIFSNPMPVPIASPQFYQTLKKASLK